MAIKSASERYNNIVKNRKVYKKKYENQKNTFGDFRLYAYVAGDLCCACISRCYKGKAS